MRRTQITQIINTRWCPEIFKRLIAEFLDWFVVKINGTKPFIPVIEGVQNQMGSHPIINVDFNLGAGIKTVAPFFNKPFEILSVPIDSFNTSRLGTYLFVNSFHQLSELQARRILKDITNSKNPVIIVEGNNDSLWQIVGMMVFVPLTILLSAPFVRPFRWSRLLFTYLTPILPLFTVIDGCIALLKLYNPDDLKELTSTLADANYEWNIGKNDNGRGGKIIYLTGVAK